MSSKRDATAADGGGEDRAAENSEGGTTAAMQRKRSRRVSFAELTSVHFFDRDEECNEAPSAENSAVTKEESEELKILMSFHGFEDAKGVNEEHREDGNEGSDDDDDDFSDVRRSFLRPIGSPSPGSTVGSANSNDEDNFFGPVSASFIRPGRLSDSAASDDNHDVTMDSTAFSMHFRSLARSDSGVELRTPTDVRLSSLAKSDSGVGLKTPVGLHLSFEQKTPTHDNVGNSMDLSVLKKPISTTSSWNINCTSGSSDMSLIVDDLSKYNYGRLPPELEALSTEDGKCLPTVSASHNIVASPSPKRLGSKYSISKANESGLMDIMDNGNEVSPFNKVGKGKSGSTFSPVSSSKSDFSSNKSSAVPLDNFVNNFNSSPDLSRNMKTSSPRDTLSTAENFQPESPMMDLVSSLPSKGSQGITISVSPPQQKRFTMSLGDISPGQGRQIPEKGSPSMYTSAVTPQEKAGSFLSNKHAMHKKSSSIQKSISKLNYLEASPFSSFLASKFEDTNIGALGSSKPSPSSTFLVEGRDGFQSEHLERPVIGSARQLLSDAKINEELECASLLNDDQIEDPSGRGHTVLKVSHDLPGLKSPIGAKAVTSVTSLLPEVGLEHVRGKKAISTPHKFASLDEAQKAKIVPQEHHGLFADNFVLRNRLKNLQNFFSDHGSASKGGIIDADLSTAGLDESGPLYLESGLHPRQPLVLNNPNLVDRTSEDVSSFSHLGTIQNIENLGTPEKVNDKLQTGTDSSMFGSGHPGGESEASASVQSNLKALIVRKNLACQNLLDSFTQSPSKSDRQVINSNILETHEVDDVLSPVCDKSESPGQKMRKRPAVEENHGNEAVAYIRNPKVQKIRGNEVTCISHHNKDGQKTLIVGREVKPWTAIFSKFSKESENIFCSSTDKLNVSLIELLEDYLVRLWRSKAYGIIRNRIIDQKKAYVDVLHYERVGEARMLLHQVIHEKGKLQLVRAKRQKLLERVQLLKVGMGESQNLKMNLLSKLLGDAQADIADYQNSVRSKYRVQVTGEKVTAMKQELEALDRKASNLIKTLTAAHKIKADSCHGIIQSVNDQLMKQLFFRDIRTNSKMWVVNEVKSIKGHHTIVLNYLGYTYQSFDVTCAPASVMAISHRLHETMISKKFPRSDACTAFSFVLNAETTQKYFSSRSLAQETQVASSVLGNLIDVLKEIQEAKVELQNMTKTAFRCSSVGQLDLHIWFFNFKSGKKVMLTLDLSCLKRGVYPSQIVPSQLATGNRGKDSSAGSMISEINDAVRDLRAGYMRILRLCRLVSQVVQASKA